MNKEIMFSSAKDNWATPQQLFDELNNEFHFTIDVCADEKNHKCAKYYDKSKNGLKQSWRGETAFCNPPYGRKSTADWIKKCYDESLNANTIIVMLIPARTDTIAFHKYIYNNANVQIRFVKGRLKFGGCKNAAPFPSMIVIFNSGNRNESSVESKNK